MDTITGLAILATCSWIFQFISSIIIAYYIRDILYDINEIKYKIRENNRYFKKR